MSKRNNFTKQQHSFKISNKSKSRNLFQSLRFHRKSNENFDKLESLKNDIKIKLREREREREREKEKEDERETVDWLSGMVGYGSYSLSGSSEPSSGDEDERAYSTDSTITSSSEDEELKKEINEKKKKTTTINISTNKGRNNNKEKTIAKKTKKPQDKKAFRIFGTRSNSSNDQNNNTKEQHSSKLQDSLIGSLIQNNKILLNNEQDNAKSRLENVSNQQLTQGTSIQKHHWLAHLMKSHPEILKVRERSIPITKSVSFAKLKKKGRTEIKQQVGEKMILRLILDFLSSNNFQKSLQALEDESKIKTVSHYEKNDKIRTILGMVVTDVNNIWDENSSNLDPLENGKHSDLVQIHENKNILIAEEDDELKLIPVWDEIPTKHNVIYFKNENENENENEKENENENENENKEENSSQEGEKNGKRKGGQIENQKNKVNQIGKEKGKEKEKEKGKEKEKEKEKGKEKESDKENENYIQKSTLNQLIRYLIENQKKDPRFVKIFLMTYQSFTSPGKLLYKLFEAFHVPDKLKGENETKKEFEERKFQLETNILNILRYWLLVHFNDFSEALVDEIQNFISENLIKQSRFEFTSSLRSIISLQQKGGIVNTNTEEAPPPEPKVPKNLFSKQLNLFDFHAIELARQISISDFEIFSKIHQSELFNCAWSKEHLKHRAKNVSIFINRFNLLSSWVSSLIVETEGLKNRAHVLRKFIKIANNLYKLNNFNSCYSILAGIESSAVHRLKFTFEELSAKYLEYLGNLKTIMSSKGSYKNYRTLIETITPPCIPYLGIFLTDLTFIEDGNPDYINGLINFTKRKLNYRVIEKIKKFQKAPYNLHPVHQITTFLNKFPHQEKSTLYKLSLKIEPRGAKKSDLKL
ncbi:ras guanine nucleotide exchange factor i-related [Anaeramoeba flamelloides]|uniref:Ras guanine nucleotide exchange factor i-related n=1 Tax=Anaeramoeba flamelloides TaxID=1746091 RepID=A0AAV8ADQ6_9EUKA|nr:ras guanine nucleotide exchange factor i-related [Anaeramoeba flamelloides]